MKAPAFHPSLLRTKLPRPAFVLARTAEVPCSFILIFRMLTTIILSLSLLAGAIALMVWHWRSWCRLRDTTTQSPEQDYAWCKFRRRAQATAMMAILAMLMLASLRLDRMAQWVGAVYILTMLILIAWIVILAFADMVASRQHFGHARTRNLAEHAKLKAELYQLEEESKGDRSRGNGKAH